MDMLSSDCHVHLIPILLSYFFSTLTHIFLKTSSSTHCWNRLWHVEPEPYSLGSIFHWHPVLRIYMMPSITFLNGTIGRPTVFPGFSLRNGTYFIPQFIMNLCDGMLVRSLSGCHNLMKWTISYNSIEFWDRLLVRMKTKDIENIYYSRYPNFFLCLKLLQI
jgi:hypothetical protein